MDEDYLKELFEPFANVQVKRMFGGQGIFHEKLCLAVVVDGTLRLKADEETIPAFEAEGCTIWSYTRKDGKASNMPYWTVAEHLYDDPDEFGRWAQMAFDAALRADAA